MKKQKHIKRADRIAEDSYDLQHFDELPNTASKQEQVDALQRDLQWQKDHTDEMIHFIHDLQRDILPGCM